MVSLIWGFLNCFFLWIFILPRPQIEGLGFEFSDENSESLRNHVIPSAPPLPEYMNSPSFSDELENKSTSKIDHEHGEISSLWSGKIATGSLISSLCDSVPSETGKQEFGMGNQISQPSVATEQLFERKKVLMRAESRTCVLLLAHLVTY